MGLLGNADGGAGEFFIRLGELSTIGREDTKVLVVGQNNKLVGFLAGGTGEVDKVQRIGATGQ